MRYIKSRVPIQHLGAQKTKVRVAIAEMPVSETECLEVSKEDFPLCCTNVVKLYGRVRSAVEKERFGKKRFRLEIHGEKVRVWRVS